MIWSLVKCGRKTRWIVDYLTTFHRATESFGRRKSFGTSSECAASLHIQAGEGEIDAINSRASSTTPRK